MTPLPSGHYLRTGFLGFVVIEILWIFLPRLEYCSLDFEEVKPVHLHLIRHTAQLTEPFKVTKCAYPGQYLRISWFTMLPCHSHDVFHITVSITFRITVSALLWHSHAFSGYGMFIICVLYSKMYLIWSGCPRSTVLYCHVGRYGSDSRITWSRYSYTHHSQSSKSRKFEKSQITKTNNEFSYEPTTVYSYVR